VGWEGWEEEGGREGGQVTCLEAKVERRSEEEEKEEKKERERKCFFSPIYLFILFYLFIQLNK
jgi:hypothetical protein